MTSVSAAPVAPPQRMGLPISNGKLGTWLFLGTEIMFFTALIGSYIVLRMGTPVWPSHEAVHLEVWAGAINTGILMTSSLFVAFAYEAVRKGRGGRGRLFLFLTVLLACLFLGIKGYEYQQKFAHGILPGQIPETEQEALDDVYADLRASVVALGVGDLQREIRQLDEEADSIRNEAAKARITEGIAQQKARIEKLIEEFKPYIAAVDKITRRLAGRELTLHGPTDSAAAAVGQLKAAFPKLAAGLRVPHVIPGGNLFASCYFVLTGLHAIHLAIGILLFVIPLVFMRRLRNWHNYLENSGLYWHFVDIIWMFLFPLIYLV